jgi:MFS family permease
LLSAISYKIFGTSIFTHYVQCFVLIVIAVTPIAFCFVFPNRSIWKFMICALFGFAIALYSAERAGEVQIETFGAGFGCLAVFAFAYPNFYKKKKLLIAISAIGILGACGFKEPFLFPILAASILLCENLKDWCFRFLLPLGIAIIAGFLLLLILGYLGDFLHYFEFMQQFWVNRFGSPYKRAMLFWRLWEDMNAFSWGLGWILIVLLFAPFVLHKNNLPNIALKTLVAFLLTSFAVGLGGEFYNHHFIFAIPFYFALFALFLNAEKIKEENLNIASIIFVLLSVTVLNLPNLNLKNRAKNMERDKQEQLKEATYIDAVLEKTGIKRYMYLGRSGNCVYGWTVHSPEGPYFIQYEEWLRDIPKFKETIFSMLLNSQVVVMGWIQSPVREAVQPILDQYFTLEPYGQVADIPRPLNKYNIYFRKK